MYITIGTYYSFLMTVVLVGLESKQHNRQSFKNDNKYHLLYTYGCTS